MPNPREKRRVSGKLSSVASRHQRTGANSSSQRGFSRSSSPIRPYRPVSAATSHRSPAVRVRRGISGGINNPKPAAPLPRTPSLALVDTTRSRPVNNVSTTPCFEGVDVSSSVAGLPRAATCVKIDRAVRGGSRRPAPGAPARKNTVQTNPFMEARPPAAFRQAQLSRARRQTPGISNVVASSPAERPASSQYYTPSTKPGQSTGGRSSVPSKAPKITVVKTEARPAPAVRADVVDASPSSATSATPISADSRRDNAAVAEPSESRQSMSLAGWLLQPPADSQALEAYCETAASQQQARKVSSAQLGDDDRSPSQIIAAETLLHMRKAETVSKPLHKLKAERVESDETKTDAQPSDTAAAVVQNCSRPWRKRYQSIKLTTTRGLVNAGGVKSERTTPAPNTKTISSEALPHTQSSRAVKRSLTSHFKPMVYKAPWLEACDEASPVAGSVAPTSLTDRPSKAQKTAAVAEKLLQPVPSLELLGAVALQQQQLVAQASPPTGGKKADSCEKQPLQVHTTSVPIKQEPSYSPPGPIMLQDEASQTDSPMEISDESGVNGQTASSALGASVSPMSTEHANISLHQSGQPAYHDDYHSCVEHLDVRECERLLRMQQALLPRCCQSAVLNRLYSAAPDSPARVRLTYELLTASFGQQSSRGASQVCSVHHHT